MNIRRVSGDEKLLLISERGIIIKTSVEQINTIGRNTQGVRVMNLSSGDKLQRVAVMRTEDKNEDTDSEEEKSE